MGAGAPSHEVKRWVRTTLPRLLRAHQVEAAYLFGSWGRDEADELSDIDIIVVAESKRPFVERFRDFPDLIRAPTGIDLLIYTPEEFTRERRCNRFIRQALREGRRLL